jgi:hypothetical protein
MLKRGMTYCREEEGGTEDEALEKSRNIIFIDIPYAPLSTGFPDLSCL